MNHHYQPSRAQISRAAIQKLNISMRHLFFRGGYKPLGVSGETMIESMLALKPEIYGSIADPERVELDGLLYIFQRLPIGIEASRYIKLISKEGYEDDFEPIIPDKRRRNCYSIDKEHMYIEMTRGKSDIFDVLTHLTFMYIEAEKIRENSLDTKDRKQTSWVMLERIIEKIDAGEEYDEMVGYTHLSTILGRTYDETREACKKFEQSKGISSLFEVVYWLGQRSMEEYFDEVDREITFSAALREKLGHHIFGEMWANQIKKFLYDNKLMDKDIHIISANMHSVMNSIYGTKVLNIAKGKDTFIQAMEDLSDSKNKAKNLQISNYALSNGMVRFSGDDGTGISVQIFDCSKVDKNILPDLVLERGEIDNIVLIVMDYAFGEQAYETMDELLKPYDHANEKIYPNFKSVNIMGKAGILEGGKGDLMIPNAHIFEGSADNYPFENALTKDEFEGNGLSVFAGPMITVLGTSLQNRDILSYFRNSSWGAIGLEMEGAHYQKAIQSASQIRNSVSGNLTIRYAYYASDNPLETGSTLASGALGKEGVKPTYLITLHILKSIFEGTV